MTNKDDIKEQIIETVDEEGTVIKFELIDIVELDEIEYGLLLPVYDEEEDEDEEEEEVVIMRLKKEGEDFIFEAIEDDDEFDRVVEAIQADAESEEEDDE